MMPSHSLYPLKRKTGSDLKSEPVFPTTPQPNRKRVYVIQLDIAHSINKNGLSLFGVGEAVER